MDALENYYNQMLKRFGVNDPRALAWRDDDSQLSRFKVLCEVGDLSGKSILDEGCGLGDLYPYLKKEFGDITYKGIDINPQFITNAQIKYPETTFEAVDFSSYTGEKVDYVLASGTLSFRIPNAEEVYFAQIKKMFAMSRRGVAFNMLDAESFEGNDLYVTYHISDVQAFCSTLTGKLVVRTDYSPEDFTVYLYH